MPELRIRGPGVGNCSFLNFLEGFQTKTRESPVQFSPSRPPYNFLLGKIFCILKKRQFFTVSCQDSNEEFLVKVKFTLWAKP